MFEPNRKITRDKEMDNFKMSLKFNAPADKLYDAIVTRGPEWWSTVGTASAKVGGICEFRFPKADFFARFEVTELSPDKVVQWKCIDSKHPESAGFKDLRDWIGTSLRFEVSEGPNGTSKLDFEHIGLNPMLECYDTCSTVWTHYLNKSLRGLVEGGIPEPYTE